MLKSIVTTLCFIPVFASAQTPLLLGTDSFFNNLYPDREPAYNYSFISPLYNDVLNQNGSYVPSMTNRYFMSLFGPRYKEVSSSNVGFYDFHIGQDFTPVFQHNGTSYHDNNLPDMVCRCNGVVYAVKDGVDSVLEKTAEGRSITIQCNEAFITNPNWGKVYMNYRHLQSFYGNFQTGDSIHAGDTLGAVGASGLTTTFHLHYSVSRRHNNKLLNVHTSRVFDSEAMPHLMQPLNKQAEIYQLGTWNDSALYRLVIPRTMVNIRYIKVSYDGVFQRLYDFEEMANFEEEIRDDNDFIEGLEFFAYPFNQALSAYNRYNAAKNTMPAVFPASPQRGDHFPIPNTGLFTSPAYVFDIRVLDLPDQPDYSRLSIEIMDIWGNALRAQGFQSNTSSSRGVSNPDDLLVYPNPTEQSGYLHLQSPYFQDAGSVDIRVYSPCGARLIEQKMIPQSENIRMDITHLAKGTYFLLCEIKGQIFRRPFIVQ